MGYSYNLLIKGVFSSQVARSYRFLFLSHFSWQELWTGGGAHYLVYWGCCSTTYWSVHSPLIRSHPPDVETSRTRTKVLHGDQWHLPLPHKAFWWTPVRTGARCRVGSLRERIGYGKNNKNLHLESGNALFVCTPEKSHIDIMDTKNGHILQEFPNHHFGYPCYFSGMYSYPSPKNKSPSLQTKRGKLPKNLSPKGKSFFQSSILDGGFKYFLSLKMGKIPILTNIFQMGWNHQPVNVSIASQIQIRRCLTVLTGDWRSCPPTCQRRRRESAAQSFFSNHSFAGCDFAAWYRHVCHQDMNTLSIIFQSLKKVL